MKTKNLKFPICVGHLDNGKTVPTPVLHRSPAALRLVASPVLLLGLAQDLKVSLAIAAHARQLSTERCGTSITAPRQ